MHTTKQLSLVIILANCLLLTSMGLAQNVGINGTGAVPNAVAGLDVDYTDKGLLIPRVTLCQRTTPSCADGMLDGSGNLLAAAQGLMVYQTDAGGNGEGFYYNISTTTTPNWVKLFGGPSSGGWALTGNSGTTAGTNFIGTTDAQDFAIFTDNSEKMRVLSDGTVGIGTSSPTGSLDLYSGLVYNILNVRNSNIGGNYMKFGAGSSAAVIGFPNTGNLWIQATDTIGNAAGITHMAIDSIGNVGLGTISMDAKLHLYDLGSAEIIIEADINDGVGEEQENPTIIFRQDANINNGLIGLNGELDSNYTGSMQNAFYMEAQGNTSLNDIQFVTGATGVGAGDGIARMTITEAGNVGIGLNNPSTLLHVGGDARIGELTDDDGSIPGEGSRLYFSGGDDWPAWNSDNSDAIYLVRYNADNDNSQLRLSVGDNGQNTDKFEFGYTNAGIWNPQVVFETGGNVGIGTTTPTEHLVVGNTVSTNDEKIKITSNADAMLELIADNDNSTETDNAGILFSQDGADIQYFIGTCGELDKDPFGNAFPGIMQNSLVIGNIYNVADPNQYIHFGTDDSVRMTIHENGNIGIGETSPNAKLHVSGGIGDVELLIEADTDNAGEDDNPTLILRQDGNLLNGLFAYEGNIGNRFTNSLQNSLYIENTASSSTPPIQFVTGASGYGFTDGVARMTIMGDGKIGIGTNAPTSIFHVAGSINDLAGSPANHVVLLENTNAGASPDVLALKVGTVNPTGASNFITFFDGGNTAIGRIEGNSANNTVYVTTGSDFAEWLPKINSNEYFEAWDIVGVFEGKISKTTKGAQLVSVISDRAGFLGNAPETKEEENTGERVAFIGQVPVKIIGTVNAGDYITPSGNNDGIGVAVKPSNINKNMQIVGIAWESNLSSAVKPVNVAIGMGIQANKMLQTENEELQNKMNKMQDELDMSKRDQKTLMAEIDNIKQHLQLEGDDRQ